MAVVTSAVIGGLGVAASVSAASKDRKAAKNAVKSQERQNASNKDFIGDQAAKAREDIIPRFEAAQQARLQGAQTALGIFGEALPQQAQLFQQGNVAAQQLLGGGSQQFQNAILGLPVDRSIFQPQQFETDFSFAQNLLQPEVPQEPLAPPQVPQAPQSPLAGVAQPPPQFLGGGFRGVVPGGPNSNIPRAAIPFGGFARRQANTQPPSFGRRFLTRR